MIKVTDFWQAEIERILGNEVHLRIPRENGGWWLPWLWLFSRAQDLGWRQSLLLGLGQGEGRWPKKKSCSFGRKRNSRRRKGRRKRGQKQKLALLYLQPGVKEAQPNTWRDWTVSWALPRRKLQRVGVKLNFELNGRPSRRLSGPRSRREKGTKEGHLLKPAPAQLEKPPQEWSVYLSIVRLMTPHFWEGLWKNQSDSRFLHERIMDPKSVSSPTYPSTADKTLWASLWASHPLWPTQPWCGSACSTPRAWSAAPMPGPGHRLQCQGLVSGSNARAWSAAPMPSALPCFVPCSRWFRTTQHLPMKNCQGTWWIN